MDEHSNPRRVPVQVEHRPKTMQTNLVWVSGPNFPLSPIFMHNYYCAGDLRSLGRSAYNDAMNLRYGKPRTSISMKPIHEAGRKLAASSSLPVGVGIGDTTDATTVARDTSKLDVSDDLFINASQSGSRRVSAVSGRGSVHNNERAPMRDQSDMALASEEPDVSISTLSPSFADLSATQALLSPVSPLDASSPLHISRRTTIPRQGPLLSTYIKSFDAEILSNPNWGDVHQTSTSKADTQFIPPLSPQERKIHLQHSIGPLRHPRYRSSVSHGDIVRDDIIRKGERSVRDLNSRGIPNALPAINSSTPNLHKTMKAKASLQGNIFYFSGICSTRSDCVCVYCEFSGWYKYNR